MRMSDLIDRQALKNKICDCCEGKDEWCNGPCFEIMIIDSMPAIAASPWHRVDEELPDKYTQCLVADADGRCAVGYYRYDCEAWDSPAFGWIESEERIYIDDMPMGIGKVVAWMPIEPPKE